jgi:hypothetical protein
LCWWEALVTTGAWNPRPATGRGRLRASDADRERAVDTLKDAFVQGMLTKDELDIRAGQALTSRTYAELTAITHDIPARLTWPLPPPEPPRASARRPVGKKAIAWATCAVVLPPALSAAFLTYYGGFLILFLFAFIGLTVTTGPLSSGR